MSEFKRWLIERFKIERKRFDRSGVYAYTQRAMAYNSNKIEGSTLTPEQTASLFDNGTLPVNDDYYRAKDVEAEMKQLLEWYHKQEKSMKVLAEFHARYESIHPFQDGNGRTGRMILFRESLKYDELTPFIILDDNRSRYLVGLKEFREHQKVDQLLELMQKEAETYYQECQYFIS